VVVPLAGGFLAAVAAHEGIDELFDRYRALFA
jgi:hypothetical protein